jgi:predicted branched-subunit amino acid permease
VARTIPEGGYGGAGAARAAGARHALGVPALVLGATFIGFGSLVRQSGLSVWQGLASTASTWALPGQIAMAELYGVGASTLAIVVAVSLTAIRLLPMTVALVPLVRDRRAPRWRLFLAAHFIAVTVWTGAMRACPGLPVEERVPYLTGYGLLLMSVTLVSTATGHVLADSLPDVVALGLVFINPIYFMLVFTADVRDRAKVMALGAGAAMGPLLHLLSPDYGLLLTGLVAGTAAFAMDRLLRQRGV